MTYQGTNKPKLLELFAGSRSVGKEAEKLEYEVFSVDVEDFEGIDLVIDIEFLESHMIPFVPDVIWISIPCTSWSMAGIKHHRLDRTIAISDFAKKSDKLLNKSLSLVAEYLVLNPDLIWYFENPRACLRHMPQMLGLPRTTVWYCKYGANHAKPTDIWSNNIYSAFCPNGWRPRPECNNHKYAQNGEIIKRHCHHEGARRGAKTGTQGMKGNYERSRIPPLLCKEILQSCLVKI